MDCPEILFLPSGCENGGAQRSDGDRPLPRARAHAYALSGACALTRRAPTHPSRRCAGSARRIRWRTASTRRRLGRRVAARHVTRARRTLSSPPVLLPPFPFWKKCCPSVLVSPQFCTGVLLPCMKQQQPESSLLLWLVPACVNFLGREVVGLLQSMVFALPLFHSRGRTELLFLVTGLSKIFQVNIGEYALPNISISGDWHFVV